MGSAAVRLALLAIALLGCGGGTTTPRAAVATPAGLPDPVEAPAPAETAHPETAHPETAHPIAALRDALLADDPDTPHHGEALGAARARLEALDLAGAPPPSVGMTCAFVGEATPIVSLHAAGVINWNSSRFDDLEITEAMVDRWCDDLDELARVDCEAAGTRSPRWADVCGELEDLGDPPPTVAERRASLDRGRRACADRRALRRRCADGAVATAEDARRFAAVRRAEVEAFFERGVGMYHGIDSDPEAVAEQAVRLVERLGRATAGPAR